MASSTLSLPSASLPFHGISKYLPIEGLAAFNKVTAELLLGADNPVIKQQRVATVQGLSGTGSLRLAAALIERYFPGAKVLISSPTWGNHKNIFNDARVPWLLVRDPLFFFTVVLNNPTGIDPTPEQWEIIADVIQEKNHILFFDIAYQDGRISLAGLSLAKCEYLADAIIDSYHNVS
ncbi:hypothetical protein V6N13_062397 [Hibiscus sabdariffa]